MLDKQTQLTVRTIGRKDNVLIKRWYENTNHRFITHSHTWTQWLCGAIGYINTELDEDDDDEVNEKISR